MVTGAPVPRRRAWVRDKVRSLAEALAPLQDGNTLGLGGFTLYRRPIAAVLAVLDSGIRNLTLIDCVAALEADILIGASCVSTLRSCYCGMEIFGLATMFRREAEHGRLNAIQETEATITYGLRAAMARTDFIPARIFAGTQMLDLRPDLQLVGSPYSGTEYVAVPAIYPDVSIVHAVAADPYGNAVLGGELAIDVELAAASRYTVLTTETLVSTEEIAKTGADILGGWVDAVVETPRGAWPTSCLPAYSTDMSTVADYVTACEEGRFAAYVASLRRHAGP